MSATVHPSAVVDAEADLADGAVVGPFAVIGARVVVGEGCRVDAHATIEGPTTLGPDNHVFPHASIGTAPQDLKYAGEDTSLEIGARNQFREFCTVNRGTMGGGGVTRIGDDNLLMTGSHIGHDSQVGSHTVFANSGTLAGHVEVGDWAVVGAFSAVHQFCRVGAHAYLGGYTVVTMDALPYAISVGQKAACMGLNRIGLKRRGFGDETLRRLEAALRLLTRPGLNRSQALERLRGETDDPHVRALVEFVEGSERGFIRASRRGARGGG
ncbi:MAG TPA: acyl-ACP--UDP-N-acetylglucosamine O-acyltransferase [Thermoanaerobaculia bacterium]|nr:acyl-ACP--UDP-N-acetylglucosamine O-acyltransferase [Thermoanaerobaculia bacterium]